MRLEANVGMVKGHKKAHHYAQHLKFKTGVKKNFKEFRNAKRVK